MLVGPYKCVRNPQYLGVILVALGETLLSGRIILFGYSILLAMGYHLFVRFYEESVDEAVWLTSAKQGLVLRPTRPTDQTLTLLLPFPYWIPMPSNALANISLQQLKQAVAIREKIESLENELSRIIGGRPSTAKSGAPTPKRKRRKMSVAARAKISAAAKARWANFRAKKGKK